MHLPVFGGRRVRDHARPADPDVADMDDVVHRLQRLAHDNIKPSDEFRVGLRANLMARIDREGIGVTATGANPDRGDTAPRRNLRRCASTRLAAFGIAALTVAVVGFGVAASSGAVPGGLHYNVERSAEQARIDAASTPLDRGRLFLEFARTRMAEADAAAGDSATLPGILNVMDAQTHQGVSILTGAAVARHSTAPLDVIDTFVADQRRGLPDSLFDITGTAHARAVTSVQLIDAVDQRVNDLRAAINCGAPAPVRSDDLGPKPRPCAPADRSGETPTPPAAPSPPPSSSPPSYQPTPAPAPTQPQAAPVPVPIPVTVTVGPTPNPTPSDQTERVDIPVPTASASTPTGTDVGADDAGTALVDTIGGLLNQTQP